MPNKRPRRIQKTRVLITGISGRLGQLLARRLHRVEGTEVIGIDRRPFHRKPADVEHLRIDIRRKACEDVFRTRKIDVIFHLGLMHDPRQGSGEHHSWNLLGTQRMMDFAQRYEVPKVVVLSSADVYGPNSDNPAFIGEDAPLMGARGFPQIRDLIGVDMFVQSYFWKAPVIETVLLRPVNILGGVRNAVSKYLRASVVPVVLGFDPMMQVLHEEDVVTALVAAARPGVRGVYNIVGPEALPLRKLVAETGRPTVNVPHVMAPRLLSNLYLMHLVDMPAAELDYLRFAITLDGSRARRELGFRHRYSVADAVRAAMRTDVFDGASLIADA